MPLALARALDARTYAVTTALVGRSRHVDTVAALAASHLAKLHMGLLGVLLIGGLDDDGWRRREAGLRISVALPVTIAVVSLVGRLFERQRPFARVIGQSGAAGPLVEHAAHRSFPSRHSACAAAMTVVAFPAAPTIGTLMGLGALGLAVSRVYTGLHYPTDIVAGWLIGATIGIIARRKELPGALWT